MLVLGTIPAAVLIFQVLMSQSRATILSVNHRDAAYQWTLFFHIASQL